MLEVELENAKGAKTSSKVYVVEGHEAEPLLGDKDAEELGFIIFIEKEVNQHKRSARQSVAWNQTSHRNCATTSA